MARDVQEQQIDYFKNWNAWVKSVLGNKYKEPNTPYSSYGKEDYESNKRR